MNIETVIIKNISDDLRSVSGTLLSGGFLVSRRIPAFKVISIIVMPTLMDM